ncbi:MAG TPA: phosphoribosylamine--glycine ligase [Acidobacteriota bacterium]|nr:phosphoribosylamine--glycine ligase [Acidobacteriota bacterium]
MKVLVLGSGGREHALVWKLAQSPLVEKVYCAPGNPGTAGCAENISIRPDDADVVLKLVVDRDIDLTVVGPEAPLVCGIADRLRAVGKRVAGPDRAAAQLEGSKVFTKRFLSEIGVPTARFEVFDEALSAEAAVRSGRFSFPLVVKADGLAAGKGVLICSDQDEALAAVAGVMQERRFGAAGNRIVIEEFLVGEEVSFMVLTDGENVVPMVPSQDHKAAFDDDKGPNTGGMGAYSMDALLTPELRETVIREIIRPTVAGMAERGTPFRGILYAGLMLTAEGPKVLEYNVRFGDPEAQAVLPRLNTDLAAVLDAVAGGDLSGWELEWKPGAAVCVVLASEGYPGDYAMGHEITGVDEAEKDPQTVIFHAGTKCAEGKLVTAGGRVLGVTSWDENLPDAVRRVYRGVEKIHFEGMHYRRDIAAKGLRKVTG